MSLINVPRGLGQKIENCTIDATREVLGKLSSAEILAWHDFGEKPFWLTNSVVLHSFMKAGGEGAMQLLRQGNHDVPVAPVPDLEPVAHEHVEIPKAPDSPPVEPNALPSNQHKAAARAPFNPQPGIAHPSASNHTKHVPAWARSPLPSPPKGTLRLLTLGLANTEEALIER